MDDIKEFQGEYRWLSNFWHVPIPVKVGNNSTYYFLTVEHAYQAAKTLSEREKYLIYNCGTPGQAKRMGSKLTIRPDWDKIKFDVMRELVSIKFESKFLSKKLLATGDANIIEGNYWHDNVWGYCYCPKCLNKEHYNMLGNIIMNKRKDLIHK